MFFFLFGVTGWMAWDACIAGLDYYDSRYKPEYDPGFFFCLLFNWPLLVCNILLIYLSTRVTLSFRIYLAYAVIIIACFLMPLVTEYLPKTMAWYALVPTVMLNGAGNSFVQGGMSGFASIFPPKYITALLVGQGVNGMLLNSVKMILLAILPPDESLGAKDMNSFYDSLIFLSVFCVLFIASTICFSILLKMDFAKERMKYVTYNQKQEETEIDKILNNQARSNDSDLEEENIDESPKGSLRANSSARASYNTIEISDIDDILRKEKQNEFYQVYKKILPLAIQNVIMFFITFLVYPGTYLDTRFDMFDDSASSKAWSNIILISVFSFGDTVGRFLAGPLKLFNSSNVIFLTVGRSIFIVTGMLVQVRASPAWVFQTDLFRIVNIWLFAATNGYNVGCLMLLGPQQVEEKHKERAGMIMAFHLTIGVCIGAIFAAFCMEKI
ncbi:unnamed protein product [Moneuplotes crassus]|uniref:Uncharacterized protein n=1 Tax=Euplotes crassus TaxID=5936 RepID=A0AAD1XF08_EUPCR|nr:unnamed protein product [Moneuplotes crassus]